MKNSKSVFSKVFLAITAVAVLSFAACDDPDDDHHANTAVITFTSPAENATFSLGDTVHVEGVVIGEEDLHGYDLYILNKTSDDTVYQVDEHAHGDTVQVQHFWVVDVTVASDMELGIIVTLDHDNNTETKKVNFACVP